MSVSLLIALALWYAMGSLIVREKIPAFIITLGGLLVFKGLFWLAIIGIVLFAATAGWAWLKRNTSS